MHRTLTTLTILALCTPVSEAGAREAPCAQAPVSLTKDVDTLIERSSIIVLAELKPAPLIKREGARDGATLTDRTLLRTAFLTFTPLETLKGTAPEPLLMAATPPHDAGAYAALGFDEPYERYRRSFDEDFNGHADDDFWQNSAAGRLRVGPGCRLQGEFLPDRRYLLFLTGPHVKGAELIREEEDDAWLSYVRERVAAAPAQAPP